MAFGFDETYAFSNFLGFRKIIVCSVRETHRNYIVESLQFGCVYLLFVYIDFGIRERAQFTAVVCVLVGEQNLCHLFRFVSECLECLHVTTNVFPCVQNRVLIGRLLGCARWKARVD